MNIVLLNLVLKLLKMHANPGLSKLSEDVGDSHTKTPIELGCKACLNFAI